MKSMTRKARVLKALRDANGGWLDGHQLVDPFVGGTEGLRRLRELRDDGWPIEHRYVAGPIAGVKRSQYRLARSEQQLELEGVQA